MRTAIYHITHKDNLPRIISMGGVYAQSQMKCKTIEYSNIAHGGIQDRRSETIVPCGPGGCLHDYVPFYFAPRSPMLYAIKMGNAEKIQNATSTYQKGMATTEKGTLALGRLK